MYRNSMKLIFDAKSENERLARVSVTAFMAALDPMVDEMADIKTAVSEAVTNAIVHGYEEKGGDVIMECMITGKILTIIIEDKGVGIEDVDLARQPMFTTKRDKDRSGMGFMFMEAFMDEVEVWSRVGEGTRVTMKKVIGVEM